MFIYKIFSIPRRCFILLWKIRMRKHFHISVHLNGIPKIKHIKGGLLVGEHCTINGNCWLSCRGGISIGNNVSISRGCSFIASGLDPDKFFKGEKTHIGKKIIVGNNVWIATNSTILGGVTIADNIIVAAGSVVTKDLLDSYAVYAGVPAKKVKQYSKDDMINK